MVCTLSTTLPETFEPAPIPFYFNRSIAAQIKSEFPDNFRLDYALSREQTNKDGGKMYIQDKVAEYSDEIFTRMDNVTRCLLCMFVPPLLRWHHKRIFCCGR